MTIEQEPMSNKDVKVEEKIYERLYKIKDSQLKEPINDMEKEDLTIDKLLDHIEESIKINETSIINARKENKRLREALGRIAKNRTEYTCDYMECECWNWADEALKGE